MDFNRVYGINACLMYAKNRKEKIVRAYFSEKVAPMFSDVMKFLAAQKKVYRIVPNEELEKISQSRHTEGVCFTVVKEKTHDFKDWLGQTKNKQLIVLEKIGNPHNLGAIMRTCAHFGFDAIATTETKIAQSGAAMRVAEGGAEFVQLVAYDDLGELVRELKKKNFEILTTSSHDLGKTKESKSIYNYNFPAAFALIFGEESRGLSKEALGLGSICLKIPGTDQVESLNLSTAISVFLSEVYRQCKKV